MKIYIAGRTSQREEVKRLNKIFKSKGFEVLDWTDHLSTKPFDANRRIATKYAIEDLDFISDCDVFILLTSDVPGLGSTSEFGMALMSNKTNKKPIIYVVGSQINNMFYYHPEVRVRKTIEEVLSEI